MHSKSKLRECSMPSMPKGIQRGLTSRYGVLKQNQISSTRNFQENPETDAAEWTTLRRPSDTRVLDWQHS